jgi:hypothetical protein
MDGSNPGQNPGQSFSCSSSCERRRTGGDMLVGLLLVRWTMRRSLPVIYLSVNVTCALVVMYAAHRVAAVMAMEQRVASDSVDGITFFAISAPAFLIAAMANAAWTGKVIVDLWRRRGNRALQWLGAAVAVWAVAIVAIRLFPSF